MYTLKINKHRATIVLGKKQNGEYPVLSCSLESGDKSVFIDSASCPDGTKNLDTDSDYAQIAGLSACVQVGNCVIGTSTMRAKSVDELQAAVNKVNFVARDPEAV